MSTPYPPATHPAPHEQPHQPPHFVQPPPAPLGTDPVSVLGLVFAFLFWPLGLVLSLVGLSRTGRGKRPGRGLAVAGTIVSALAGVVAVLVIALMVGAANQAAQDLDAAAVQFEEDMAELDAELEAAADDLDAVAAEEGVLDEGADEVVAEVSVGEPATVDGITFTVVSQECGETSVGEEFLSVDAQGVFCLYDVRVENGSTDPYMFDASFVTGYLGDAAYDADGEASLYVDGEAFLENVNPGNAVEATVVFDVPEGVQLDRLELSPGFFSFDTAVVTLR